MENIPPEHRIFAYPKLNIREQMAAYQEVIDLSLIHIFQDRPCSFSVAYTRFHFLPGHGGVIQLRPLEIQLRRLLPGLQIFLSLIHI